MIKHPVIKSKSLRRKQTTNNIVYRSVGHELLDDLESHLKKAVDLDDNTLYDEAKKEASKNTSHKLSYEIEDSLY